VEVRKYLSVCSELDDLSVCSELDDLSVCSELDDLSVCSELDDLSVCSELDDLSVCSELDDLSVCLLVNPLGPGESQSYISRLSEDDGPSKIGSLVRQQNMPVYTFVLYEYVHQQIMIIYHYAVHVELLFGQ
jgi:hypothetical protein